MNTPSNSPDPFVTSGKHISFWTQSTAEKALNPLRENLETEVVIVGGGLAGVSIAYCLTKSGKRVVLVEDGRIGSGETGRTTAHLVTALDDRYYHLEKLFGEEKTKLIAESHQAAINFVEQTVKNEQIDCGFERVTGYLFLHPTDEPESLDKELEAGRKAGVTLEMVGQVPGLQQSVGGIAFLNQAQFHPLKYIQALCGIIDRNGGRIYTGTHASEINHEGITTSDGFHVKANHVVVATNSPVNNLFAMMEKQYPYRTYVIGALVRKNMLPPALWWDTGDFEANAKIPPYHYVRLHPYNDQYDLLISGGEDHPTGDTSKIEVAEEERYRLVEAWTRKNFPVGEVVFRWSGQVMEPMDGVAYIGRNSFDHDNVYIVTGDSGNGMTHCSLAGLLISDLINGKENKWEKLYSPKRFSLKSGAAAVKQFFNETLAIFKQMPNFKGLDEIDKIQTGEGKVVDMLEEQFGVYRDQEGDIHIVSAKCTHLKCTVSWNADELSWDCPCHGSRFTFEGKVINGPANFDLPSYRVAEKKMKQNKS